MPPDTLKTTLLLDDVRAFVRRFVVLNYEHFCDALASVGVGVARGVFGARMVVELANDGPVTIILE